MTPKETAAESYALDVVPFFSSTGAMAEMESLSIQGILDANGIPYTVSGGSTLPVLEFVVSVPRALLPDAQKVVDEARAAGPAAAEEGERQSELDGAKPE